MYIIINLLKDYIKSKTIFKYKTDLSSSEFV